MNPDAPVTRIGPRSARIWVCSSSIAAISICRVQALQAGYPRPDLIDDEASAVSINAVVARDWRNLCVQRQIWVVAGDNAARAIPDVPIACAIRPLDHHEPCACGERAVDRLAASVTRVAADLAHAGDGGEEVGNVGVRTRITCIKSKLGASRLNNYSSITKNKFQFRVVGQTIL